MLQKLKSRRSHFLKEFNGDHAPKELITELLDAAIWAPSHKLTLPFKFVVYEPAKLNLLAQKIQESFIQTQKEPQADKIAKIASYPTKLSHAIAIILIPSHKVPLWEEYAALGAAVQNMYLMLSEQPNFGGYWTTGNEMNQPIIREFLSLHPEEIHCGYFFIGGINEKRSIANRPQTDVLWF